MQQDLWKLRRQRGWTINQLAAESQVPGLSIYEYEQGRPIRAADLPRLAAALGVAPDTVRLQSPAKPRKTPQQGTAKRRSPAQERPVEFNPATDSQIQHLIALAARLGETREQLESKVARPLETMGRKEIGTWLTQYTHAIRERKTRIAADPAGTKRWRAHLPEGVDSHELAYLTQQRQNGSEVNFTLFDGQRFVGRIVGFGPYSITIRTADDHEMTLQKLAVAYYALTAGEGSIS